MASATDDVAGAGEVAAAAAAAEGERDWSQMTAVCLAEAFGRLGLEDLWRGVMVCCHAWREVARSRPELFAELDLEPAFSAAGSGITDDAQWWTPAFQRRIDDMLRSAAELAAGELRVARLRHCSDDALAFAVERSPNLSILSIRSSQSVSDRSVFHVAVCCPMLTELDISNCYEVSYNSLELIGRNCQNLTVLKRNLLNWLDPSQHVGIVPDDYLRACPQDGNREATTIANFMPKLKHLELQFSKLSIFGLTSIVAACRDLEVLDLFGCANLPSIRIDEVTAHLKNLETLVKPNFYIPRSAFLGERYGHWQLYDERFQTNAFQI